MWNFPIVSNPAVRLPDVGSHLSSVAQHFQKQQQMQQQEAARQEQLKMAQQRMEMAQAAQQDNRQFRDKSFDATQEHRNRLFQLQEQKAKAGPQRPWWAKPDGTVDPAMAAKTAAGRPQVTVNNAAAKADAAGMKEYSKKLQGGFAEMALEGIKGSRKARQEIQGLYMLRSAVKDPNVHFGRGGESMQWLKKGMEAIGLKVDGVGSGELIKRLSTELALSEKDKLPGPLSNSDVRLLLSMPAGLQKTREGNRLIIEMGLLQREYLVARNTEMAKYYRAKKGQIDPFEADEILQNVDKQFAQKFREFLPRLKAGGQELAPSSPAAGMGDLRKMYELE